MVLGLILGQFYLEVVSAAMIKRVVVVVDSAGPEVSVHRLDVLKCISEGTDNMKVDHQLFGLHLFNVVGKRKIVGSGMQGFYAPRIDAD
jgi:hypothetical protein